MGKRAVAFILIVAVAGWVGMAEAQLDRLRKLQKEAEQGADREAPMALIPAGEFWMGIDGTVGLYDEKPRHKVVLDAFYMDIYEVTTRRYAQFLKETKRKAPWLWELVKLDIHGDRPVVGVSWFDADEYCRWTGKRLPTEAEWEKAARGTDERLYPWGNVPPNAELANFALGARFSYSQALMPVGHYHRAKSPYGLYDMAGNVWEWVQDWYESIYYEHSPEWNPAGPETGEFKALRGGAWSDLPKYLLTYGRFKLPPDTQNSYIGFRCAKSVSAEGKKE